MRSFAVSACVAAVASSAGAQAVKSPWYGTWVLKDAGDKPETLIYSDAGGGAMRMESVEIKSIIVTRFDGMPAGDTGAGAKEGSALAIKAESPTRYRWTFLKKGAPFVRGVNILRPDGRAFDEVSWLVSNSADKVTLVYERR